MTLSVNELCAVPLTTSCNGPAGEEKINDDGLEPVCVASTALSDPYTVSVSGDVFEYASVAFSAPEPVVSVNARELFLFVTAPLKLLVMVADAPGTGVGAGVAVGEGVGAKLGDGNGVAVGEGAGVGAGVGVGELPAGAPSAKRLAYASTLP